MRASSECSPLGRPSALIRNLARTDQLTDRVFVDPSWMIFAGSEVDHDRSGTRTPEALPEPVMSFLRVLLSDRTGLLGAGGGLFAGLPPAAVYGYMLIRLLIPVLLTVLAARGATPHPEDRSGAGLPDRHDPRPGGAPGTADEQQQRAITRDRQ